MNICEIKTDNYRDAKSGTFCTERIKGKDDDLRKNISPKQGGQFQENGMVDQE